MELGEAAGRAYTKRFPLACRALCFTVPQYAVHF